MSETPSIGANGPQKAQLIWTLGLIAAMWIASDIGYYVLLPALGLPLRYGADPVPVALYYAFWVAIAVITFWHLYRGWTPFENRWLGYILFSISLGGVAVFAAFVLPLLPPIDWREGWDPPELMLSTPWYFLPKSIEILFQQLLIVAMVRAFSAQQCSIRAMSVCCASLFGGAHLLLAFGGVPLPYMIRFTTVATVFGFVFPYLILRVPNGFAYSYLTHWCYYAITVVMAHALYTPSR